MPCLGGLVDNVDVCKDVTSEVYSPLSQLCSVHEQIVNKPTPGQPCTRCLFLVLKKIASLKIETWEV